MKHIKQYIVAIALIASFIIPGSAGAQFQSDAASLQARIAALLAQIQALQAQLDRETGKTPAFCYTFTAGTLSQGSTGATVTALHTILEKEGFLVATDEKESSLFDESTAAAVSGFQEKYRSEILTPSGLRYPTGFPGRATKAKLNALYGCRSGQTPPVVTPPAYNTPVITEITPSYGKQGETASVIIRGRNFTGASEFSGNGITIFPQSSGVGLSLSQLISDTQINATLPINITTAPGTYFITIQTPRGGTSNRASFTVLGNATTTPSVTILSPNGGEVWYPGETHRIQWNATGIRSVKIYIYDSNILGSGSTNYVTPNNIPVLASQGYYDWTIPTLSQLPPFNGNGSTNYKIRIDDADNIALNDSGNAPFTISAATSPLTNDQKLDQVISLASMAWQLAGSQQTGVTSLLQQIDSILVSMTGLSSTQSQLMLSAKITLTQALVTLVTDPNLPTLLKTLENQLRQIKTDTSPTPGDVTAVKAPDDSESQAGNVTAGTEAVLAKFKFSAINETMTVRKLQILVSPTNSAIATSSSAADEVPIIKLYDGATQIGAMTGYIAMGSGSSAGIVFVQDLNWIIPRDSSKTLTVKGVLNTINSGADVGALIYTSLMSAGFEATGSTQFDTSISGVTGNQKILVDPTTALLDQINDLQQTLNEPDLIIEDIYYTAPYVYVRYKNIGAAGTGDFLIKTSTASSSFGGNSYYRFLVPQPNVSTVTGGLTVGLIGLAAGDTKAVTAEIDWEGRVAESNETNNTLTKTIAIPTTSGANQISDTQMATILQSAQEVLNQLGEYLKTR